MSETHSKAEKLQALELLAPVGGVKRVIWEVNGVELKDVPPEEIEGKYDPVTFYTEFDRDIPAEVRDSFCGHAMQMQESGMLDIGAEEVRTVTHIPTPTTALKHLAKGGGIVGGLWPKRGKNGRLQCERLTKNGDEQAKLISALSTPAIIALFHQATEAFMGDWNRGTGAAETGTPEAEAVHEAGESPTSTDD